MIFVFFLNHTIILKIWNRTWYVVNFLYDFNDGSVNYVGENPFFPKYICDYYDFNISSGRRLQKFSPSFSVKLSPASLINKNWILF